MLERLKLKNLTISSKYTVAVVLTAVLFLVSTGIIFGLLSTNVKKGLYFLEKRGASSIAVAEMNSLFKTKNQQIIKYTYSNQQINDQDLIDEFKEKEEDFKELMKKIEPVLDTRKLKELFNRLNKNNTKINNIFLKEIIPAVNKNQKTKYIKSLQKINKLEEDTSYLLGRFQKIFNQQRQFTIQKVKSSIGFTQLTLIISIIIATTLGIIVTFFISKIVKRSLNHVVEISDQIASGNLQVEKIDYNGQDEIGKLATSINTMVENLNNIIEDVINGTTDTSATARQLFAISQQSTASIEEVATSVQEFTVSTDQLSEAAQDMSLVTEEVNDLAQKGLEEMEDTKVEMNNIIDSSQDSIEIIDELSQSTQAIEDMVNDISDIAEQTNLLALNATIEAARVSSTGNKNSRGEQGHGFAVVAEEVRNLAEETQESVTNIKAMIDELVVKTEQAVDSIKDNNSQIEVGSNKLNQTEGVFNNIVDKIEIVVEGIQEVVSSSEEIAAGSEEISATTDEQSLAMQELSDSAQNLANIAQELNQSVEEFKL
ncbi:hypothetical protein JCM16358_04380 [Halanaerocella petrolearia]